MAREVARHINRRGCPAQQFCDLRIQVEFGIKRPDDYPASIQ
jgi:hypothetical protein